MANYLDKNGLLYLWQKIVGKFVAKETGKGLSTNDYTTIEKDKLGALPSIKQIGTGLELTEQGTLNASGGGTADAVAWQNVTDKPTTLSGYGITDAAPLNHNHDSSYYKKSETYSKTEIDGKGYLTEHQDISGKADKATTLSGYGITNAYTKTEVDGKLSSVYKPAGNCLFANLPTPSASNLGNVYSMMDAFTTDDRFVASEPTQYPIGTNVVVVMVDDAYYFDVLAGFVDLSGYVETSDLVAITNSEIDTIVSGT